MANMFPLLLSIKSIPSVTILTISGSVRKKFPTTNQKNSNLDLHKSSLDLQQIFKKLRHLPFLKKQSNRKKNRLIVM